MNKKFIINLNINYIKIYIYIILVFKIISKFLKRIFKFLDIYINYLYIKILLLN